MYKKYLVCNIVTTHLWASVNQLEGLIISNVNLYSFRCLIKNLGRVAQDNDLAGYSAILLPEIGYTAE